MNYKWMIPLVMTGGLLANQAMAGDVVVGAVIGSGVGAAVGKSIGGRDGAVVGGMLGAMTGVLVATNNNGRQAPDYRSRYEPRSERYTGYGYSNVVYQNAPVVVYQQRPVVVVKGHVPRVVVINNDRYQGKWHGRKHGHQHHWQAKNNYQNYQPTYAHGGDDD